VHGVGGVHLCCMGQRPKQSVSTCGPKLLVNETLHWTVFHKPRQVVTRKGS
jgi:hypothetical protein